MNVFFCILIGVLFRSMSAVYSNYQLQSTYYYREFGRMRFLLNNELIVPLLLLLLLLAGCYFYILAQVFWGVLENPYQMVNTNLMKMERVSAKCIRCQYIITQGQMCAYQNSMVSKNFENIVSNVACSIHLLQPNILFR